jgi:hypothetical protein
MSFEKTGHFRCLAQNNVRWLAFETNGDDLMTAKGDTLILEFDPSISESDLEEIANLVNERIRRAVIRAL